MKPWAATVPALPTEGGAGRFVCFASVKDCSKIVHKLTRKRAAVTAICRLLSSSLFAAATAGSGAAGVAVAVVGVAAPSSFGPFCFFFLALAAAFASLAAAFSASFLALAVA